MSDGCSAAGSAPDAVLPDDVETALVGELTTNVLSDIAPEELAMFEAHREGWLQARGSVGEGRDEMLGFGAEVLMALTPYVVAAATAALRLLGSLLLDVAVAEAKPHVAGWLRRVLHQGEGDGEPVPPLPADALIRVHDAVLGVCLDLGLEASDATLVADAVVGRVHLPGT
ncbi:MAG: hypothetical protein ACM3ZF_12580 [Mycobacterium leprae]